MHRLLNIILIPLSWIYQLIVGIRNYAYDKHWLKSYEVAVPTIAVGNLAIGGTGKTPMVEFLVRSLKDHYHVAVLSRGYGRKSKGFLMLNERSTAETVGDEMMQIYTKFPHLAMAVCEDRRKGVEQLMLLRPETQVVLLDDAYQHRALHCGFYMLLTPYNRLYINDHLLPWGQLRESKDESYRAHAIVVTKCPETMLPIDRRVVENSLQLASFQRIYFSYIQYKPLQYEGQPLIVTGIARPEYLIEHIRQQSPKVDTLIYADHHRFSRHDISHIAHKAKAYDVVLTTEKDWTRLQQMALPEELAKKIKVVAIETDLRQDVEGLIQQVRKYIDADWKRLQKRNKQA